MQDMVEKGRHRNRALTEEDVREIRHRRRQGDDPREMALEYGVSATTVYRLLKRGSWLDVD